MNRLSLFVSLLCLASLDLLLSGCQQGAMRWSTARKEEQKEREAVSGPHLWAGTSSPSSGDPFLQSGLSSGKPSGSTTAGGTFLTQSDGQTDNRRGAISVPPAGSPQPLTAFSNNGRTVVQAGYQTFVDPAGGTFPSTSSFPQPVTPAGATVTGSGPTDNSGWQPRQSGTSARTPTSSRSTLPASAPLSFPAATSPETFSGQLRP